MATAMKGLIAMIGTQEYSDQLLFLTVCVHGLDIGRRVQRSK